MAGGVSTPRMKSHRLIYLSAAMSLTLGALLTGCFHQPRDNAREALLSLPYEEFDQTPDSGWRVWFKQKRNREAVVLIEEYLKRHCDLTPKHSAIAHLKQARCDGQNPGYNEFADAMRAFLERDRDELLAIWARVAQYPPNGMTAVYQSVVGSFVERFEDSYNDVMAYEAAKKK